MFGINIDLILLGCRNNAFDCLLRALLSSSLTMATGLIFLLALYWRIKSFREICVFWIIDSDNSHLDRDISLYWIILDVFSGMIFDAVLLWLVAVICIYVLCENVH